MIKLKRFSPGRSRDEVRRILEKYEGCGQDRPDAQQVDGHIDGLDMEDF